MATTDIRQIAIAKSVLGNAEIEAVRKTIASGWVAQGPRVAAFEADFAEYTGAAHACAVTNCTTAMHLALLAVGVGPGDIVATVSHSNIATANCIRHCGGEPVFIDIDPATYNMAPEALRQFLAKDCESAGGSTIRYKHMASLAAANGPPAKLPEPARGRVAAILVVHQMGLPCELPEIIEIAKAFDLPLVEDAACAIGSEVRLSPTTEWERIGRPHGDVACFSFHPRKVITTGEGGMLVTNAPAIDQRCRKLRQHAMSMPADQRHESQTVCFEEYTETGFNYRMTDIQAAIGIEQLKRLPDILRKRRALAASYTERLQAIPWLQAVVPDDSMRPNWQSFPVRLAADAPCTQLKFMQYLLDRGIATRRGIMNAHQEPAYAGPAWNLPHSEAARDSVVLLPLHNYLEEDDTAFVLDTAKKLIE
jgi:perosamine synthetase